MGNSPLWSSLLGDRSTKRGEASENADLISGLPDELLIHILSFVPTTTSVTTSVLSKRWSRLWISVPTIDFYDFWTKSSVRRAQFENFVDRFLTMNRVMSVRTVKFCVEEDIKISRVNAWMATISECDAGQVGLSFPGSSVYELGFPIGIPDEFFKQNNLVKLELRAVVLKVPLLVCFPNLKTMNLDFIRIFDDDSMKNLLYGSPVLENLYMSMVQRDALHTLYICSSSLRNLLLETEGLDLDDDFKIVIDTPNLRDIRLSDDHCSTYYNMINLSSLVSAHLNIRRKGEAFPKLLTPISHVKDLVLDGFSSDDFDYAPLLTMPIFNYLFHLEIKFNWMENLETLFHLFKCTPNLVTFILNKPLPYMDHGPYAWFEPLELPQCFLSSIESVEIKGVEDGDQDMRMISYILKNAMVLKKLSLRRSTQCANVLAAENKFLMALFTLPRSSAACQVEYCVRRFSPILF